MGSNDGGLEEASGDGGLDPWGLEISLGGFKHLGHVFRTCIGGSEHGQGLKFPPLMLSMPMVPALVGSKVGWARQRDSKPLPLPFF